MNRPVRPAFALLVLVLALMLGGWGFVSLAPQSYLGRMLSSLTGGGSGARNGGEEDNFSGTTAGGGKGGGKNKNGDSSATGEAGGDSVPAGPSALPKGLTSIDGEGGSGFDRAVRKNGVWYPVYSPGPKPGPGAPPLTEIPLTIASGTPPAGRVDQPYSWKAEAIGGTEPYTWSLKLEPRAAADFLWDNATGGLSGISREPLKTTLNLAVTDAAGTTKSALLALVIRPEKDLSVITGDLPKAPLSLPFEAELEAEGGVPPYRWKAAGSLPVWLVIQESGGLVSGTADRAGEFPITVMVTDSQDFTADKKLTLHAGAELEITTPANLPAAAPGQDYRLEFHAEGGVEPYTWEPAAGAFPDNSWQLSPDGILQGRAPSAEALGEFSLTVRDATDATFEKTFRLAVSDLLLAVPSREKVGLAWSPSAVAGVLAGSGNPVGFAVLRDGAAVYQGTGTNFVDHGLPTGSAPEYTLLAVMADGSEQPLGSKKVTVLPMSLERGISGQRGDPFADAVTMFSPLGAGGYGAGQIPRNVTGPPDGRSTYAPAYKASEVASLHARVGAGGIVELAFTDNIVELGTGEDLTVFENVMFVGGDANQRFMEPAVISVALFPGEWHRLSTDVIPSTGGAAVDVMNPFYYSRGIAGRNPTTGDDPTNPARSGGDSFDLNSATGMAGLSWIRFIRIQSTGDQAMADDAGGDIIRHNADPNFGPLTGSGSSGFDLDAVSAVNY